MERNITASLAINFIFTVREINQRVFARSAKSYTLPNHCYCSTQSFYFSTENYLSYKLVLPCREIIFANWLQRKLFILLLNSTKMDFSIYFWTFPFVTFVVSLIFDFLLESYQSLILTLTGLLSSSYFIHL